MISVIVPVYNEGANIVPTLHEIYKHVPQPFEILIAYDRDDDDTLPAIDQLKTAHPVLYTAIRPVKNNIHRGPSGAIRTCFKEALGTEVLVTMADLSDDLSQVNEMRRLMKEGFDLVTPSRYCKGGSQDLHTIKAWIPSSMGRLMKLLTGVGTHDPTNSYRLYSAAMLKAFPVVSTHSFSLTLEITAKAHCLDFKIVEIPTTWNVRKVGESKFPFLASLISYLPWFFLALTKNRLFSLPMFIRRRLVG